jgi:hypothetical protein
VTKQPGFGRKKSVAIITGLFLKLVQLPGTLAMIWD